MKKLFFIACLFVVSKGFAQTPDSTLYVNIAAPVVSFDTLINEVNFKPLLGNYPYKLYIYCDSTNTGTLKFSVGGVLDMGSQYAYPAGSKLILNINPPVYNLRFKASDTDQKFIVTQ